MKNHKIKILSLTLKLITKIIKLINLNKIN